MEQELSFSEKVLNGFLSVMVVSLIAILAAIVVALILSAFGLF